MLRSPWDLAVGLNSPEFCCLGAPFTGDTGRRHWPATLAGGIWVGRALATGAPTQAPLTYAGTRTNQDGKA